METSEAVSTDEKEQHIMEGYVAADINIPSWVPFSMRDIYKISYGIVKDDEETRNLPSSKRKEIIIDHMKGFVEVIQEKAKKQESESEANAKEHDSVEKSDDQSSGVRE